MEIGNLKLIKNLFDIVDSLRILVEAAGIEPASESTTLKPLHAYPAYLVSDTGLPADRPTDTLSL